MPGTQLPKVPEGLRDLMKSLTKEILREKPSNIYEFSAQFFERLIEKQQDFKVKEFEPISEYDFFKTRDRSSISVALLYSIMPAGLTNLIKDFIKAVLKSRPENICAFGVEYFRRLQKVKENEPCQIDYMAFESYFRGKEKFAFTPYVKCTCGRTLGGGMALNNNNFEKTTSIGQQNNEFSGFCGTKGCEKSLEIGAPNKGVKEVYEFKYDEKTMKAIYIIQKYCRRHIKQKKISSSKQKTSNEATLLTQELSVEENPNLILNKKNSSFEKSTIASTALHSKESAALLSNELSIPRKEENATTTDTENVILTENDQIMETQEHERQKRAIAEKEISEMQNKSSVQVKIENSAEKAEENFLKENNKEKMQIVSTNESTNYLLSDDSVKETNEQIETTTDVIENAGKNIHRKESIEYQNEALKNETKSSENSPLLNPLEKIIAKELGSSTQDEEKLISDADMSIKLDKSSNSEPLLKANKVENIISLSEKEVDESNIITKETINDYQEAQKLVPKLPEEQKNSTNTDTEKDSSEKVVEIHQIENDSKLNIKSKAAEESELESTKEVQTTLDETKENKAEDQAAEKIVDPHNLTSKMELKTKALVEDNMVSATKSTEKEFPDKTSNNTEAENVLKDELNSSQNREEETLQNEDKNELNNSAKSYEEKLKDSATNILENNANLKIFDENDNIQFSEKSIKNNKTKDDEKSQNLSRPEKIQSTNMKVDSEDTSKIEDNKTEKNSIEQENNSKMIDEDSKTTSKSDAHLESQGKEDSEKIQAIEKNKINNTSISSTEIISECEEKENSIQQNEDKYHLEITQIMDDKYALKLKSENNSETNKCDEIIAEKRSALENFESHNKVNSDSIQSLEESIIENVPLNSKTEIKTFEKDEGIEEKHKESDSKCIETTEENKTSNFIDSKSDINENVEGNEAVEKLEQQLERPDKAISETIQTCKENKPDESANNLETNIDVIDRKDEENGNPFQQLNNNNKTDSKIVPIDSTAIPSPTSSQLEVEIGKENEVIGKPHQELESYDRIKSENNESFKEAEETSVSSELEAVVDGKKNKINEIPHQGSESQDKAQPETSQAFKETGSITASSESEVVSANEEKDSESTDKDSSKNNQQLKEGGTAAITSEKTFVPLGEENKVNENSQQESESHDEATNSESNQLFKEAEVTSLNSATDVVSIGEEKDKNSSENKQQFREAETISINSESEVVVIGEKNNVNENSNQELKSHIKLSSENNQAFKESKPSPGSSEVIIIGNENELNKNPHRKSEDKDKISSEVNQTNIKAEDNDSEKKETKESTISDSLNLKVDENDEIIEGLPEKPKSCDKNASESIQELKKVSTTSTALDPEDLATKEKIEVTKNSSLKPEDQEKIHLESSQTFEESSSLDPNSSELMVAASEEKIQANAALSQQSEIQDKNVAETQKESKVDTASIEGNTLVIPDPEAVIVAEESKVKEISQQQIENIDRKPLETEDTIETNSSKSKIVIKDNELEESDTISKTFENMKNRLLTDSELEAENTLQAETLNKTPEEPNSNENLNLTKPSSEVNEGPEKISTESEAEKSNENKREKNINAVNNSLEPTIYEVEKQVPLKAASPSSKLDEEAQKKSTSVDDNEITKEENVKVLNDNLLLKETNEKNEKEQIINSSEDYKIEISEDSKPLESTQTQNIDIKSNTDSILKNSDSLLKSNETDSIKKSQNANTVDDQGEIHENDQNNKNFNIHQSTKENAKGLKENIVKKTNEKESNETTLKESIFLQKETIENKEFLVSSENSEKLQAEDEDVKEIQNNEDTEHFEAQNDEAKLEGHRLAGSQIQADQETTYDEKEKTKDSKELESEKEINLKNISENKTEIQKAEVLDEDKLSENLKNSELIEAEDSEINISKQNDGKSVNKESAFGVPDNLKHEGNTVNKDPDMNKNNESSRYSSSVFVIGNQNAPKSIKSSKSDVNETIFDDNKKIKDFPKPSLENEKSPTKNSQKASKTIQNVSKSVNIEDVSKQTKEKPQIRQNVEQKPMQLPIAEIYLKSFRVIDNENIPNDAEKLISTVQGPSNVNDDFMPNSAAYSEATYRESDETEYTDSLEEDKFERDSLEIASSKDTDMDEDSLEIDQGQSMSNSLKPYTESERTATYLYGIHTPRESPIPPRKSQPKAIAYVIPFENESKKTTKESKVKTDKSEKQDENHYNKNDAKFEQQEEISNKVESKEKEVFDSPKESLNELEGIDEGETTPTESKLHTIFEQNEVESPRQLNEEESLNIKNVENKSQNTESPSKVESLISAETTEPLKTEKTEELVEEIVNISENTNHSTDIIKSNILAEIGGTIESEDHKTDNSQSDSLTSYLENEKISNKEILNEEPIKAVTKETIVSNQMLEEQRFNSPDDLSFLSDHDLSDSSTYTSSKEFEDTVLLDEHFTIRHNIRQSQISFENNDDFPKGGIYEVDIKNTNDLNDNDLKETAILGHNSKLLDESTNEKDVTTAEPAKNIENSLLDATEIKTESELQKKSEEQQPQEMHISDSEQESKENLVQENKSPIPLERKYKKEKEAEKNVQLEKEEYLLSRENSAEVKGGLKRSNQKDIEQQNAEIKTQESIISTEKNIIDLSAETTEVEPKQKENFNNNLNSESPSKEIEQKIKEKDFQISTDVEKLIESQILTESQISELSVKNKNEQMEPKELNQDLFLSKKAEETVNDLETTSQTEPNELSLTSKELSNSESLERENQKEQNIEFVDGGIRPHSVKEVSIIPNESKGNARPEVESIIKSEMEKLPQEELRITAEKIVPVESGEIFKHDNEAAELLKISDSPFEENTGEEKILIENENLPKVSSANEKQFNLNQEAVITTSIPKEDNKDPEEAQTKAEETTAESAVISKRESEIHNLLNDKNTINQSEEVPNSKNKNENESPRTDEIVVAEKILPVESDVLLRSNNEVQHTSPLKESRNTNISENPSKTEERDGKLSTTDEIDSIFLEHEAEISAIELDPSINGSSSSNKNDTQKILEEKNEPKTVENENISQPPIAIENVKQTSEVKETRIGEPVIGTENKLNKELSTNYDKIEEQTDDMKTNLSDPIKESEHGIENTSSAIINDSKSLKTDDENLKMNVEKAALIQKEMKPQEQEEPMISKNFVAETEITNQHEPLKMKAEIQSNIISSSVKEKSDDIISMQPKQESPRKVSSSPLENASSDNIALTTQNQNEIPDNNKLVDNIDDQKNVENEEETVLSKIESKLQEGSPEELIKPYGNLLENDHTKTLNENNTLQPDKKELYKSENIENSSTNDDHSLNIGNNQKDETNASNITETMNDQHDVLKNTSSFEENENTKIYIQNATDDEKSGSSVIPTEAEAASLKQQLKSTKSKSLINHETIDEINQNTADNENAKKVQNNLLTMENAATLIQKSYKLYRKRQSTVLSKENTIDDSQIAFKKFSNKTNESPSNEKKVDLFVPEEKFVENINKENNNSKINWFVGNEPIFFDNDAKEFTDNAHNGGLDSQHVNLYEKSDKFSNQITESDQALVDSTNSGFETNEVDKNSLSIGETKTLFNQTNEAKVVSVNNDSNLSLELKENVDVDGQLIKSEDVAAKFASQVDEPRDNEAPQPKNDTNSKVVEEKEDQNKEIQNNEDVDYLKFIESTKEFLKSEVQYSTVITLVEIFEDPCIKKCASVSDIDELAENIEEAIPKQDEESLKESVLSTVEQILQKPEEAIKKMQHRRSSATQLFENDENFSNQPSFDEPVILTMETIVDSRNSSGDTSDDVVIIKSSQATENPSSSIEAQNLSSNSTEDENGTEIIARTITSLKRVHTVAGDDLKTILKSVTINETIKYVELTESDATTTSGGSFCLDEDTSENIRQKMMAFSLSEADSDTFAPHLNVVEDASFDAPQDDFNINTVLEDTESTSTETESTIVSAATKIQAGARGFLARRRLRRASAGTKSPAQYDTKDSFGNNAISESLETLIENEAAKKIQKAFRKHRREQYPLIDRSNKNLGSSVPVTNVENSLAAKRLTLQRGDALRNNSSPEEDFSNNGERKNDVKSVMKNSTSTINNTNLLSSKASSSVHQKVVKRNQDRDNELKWLAIRQNSMPVQIESEIFRVIPKHMRKRNSSAETAKKRRQLSFKD